MNHAHLNTSDLSVEDRDSSPATTSSTSTTSDDLDSPGESAAQAPATVLTLDQVLSTGRTTLGLHVTSKKRLLEEMASLLCRDEPRLSHEDVFRALLERERLGPTGLGKGIALPHGRVDGIDKPIGALATLKTGLSYEAPDDVPVTLCISLIVPKDATDDHVKLLADIAERLSNDNRVAALHAASCPSDIISTMTDEPLTDESGMDERETGMS